MRYKEEARNRIIFVQTLVLIVQASLIAYLVISINDKEPVVVGVSALLVSLLVVVSIQLNYILREYEHKSNKPRE